MARDIDTDLHWKHSSCFFSYFWNKKKNGKLVLGTYLWKKSSKRMALSPSVFMTPRKALEPPLPKHRILWHHCASRAEGGSGFFRVPWPALMVTCWPQNHRPQNGRPPRRLGAETSELRRASFGDPRESIKKPHLGGAFRSPFLSKQNNMVELWNKQQKWEIYHVL